MLLFLYASFTGDFYRQGGANKKMATEQSAVSAVSEVL